MKEYTKAEIVFKQMDNCYHEMFQCRRLPLRFNELFELYLVKSQQLTYAMRKEYKHYVDHEWRANEFDGWNEYTRAITKLRNKVTHEEPLSLQHAIISIFPAVEFATDSSPPKIHGKKYKFRIMWQEELITNPFEKDRTGILAVAPVKNPKSDKFSDKYVAPVKNFFTYSFGYPFLQECISNKLLAKDKRCRDAIYLLSKSHQVFRRYHEFYQSLNSTTKCNA